MRAGNLVKFINPRYPDFLDAIGLLTKERIKKGTKHFTVEWVTKIVVSDTLLGGEVRIGKSHFSEHSLEVIS
jgi:hypothetical protein